MSNMATRKKSPAATTPPVPLTQASRCDKCGSQAYVHTTLLTGELYWCGHCYHVYEEALASVAITVDDQRDRINKTAGASA